MSSGSEFRCRCGSLVTPSVRRVKAKVLRPGDKELATVVYFDAKCPGCKRRFDAAGVGDEDAEADFRRMIASEPRAIRPVRARGGRKR